MDRSFSNFKLISAIHSKKFQVNPYTRAHVSELNIRVHILTTDAYFQWSYACKHAQIVRKISMLDGKYVDILSLKFEKDLFKCYREINIVSRIGE